MRPDERQLEENQLKRRLAMIQPERALEHRVTKAKWDQWVFTPLLVRDARRGCRGGRSADDLRAAAEPADAGWPAARAGHNHADDCDCSTRLWTRWL
jgi:hypothetical protein